MHPPYPDVRRTPAVVGEDASHMPLLNVANSLRLVRRREDRFTSLRRTAMESLQLERKRNTHVQRSGRCSASRRAEEWFVSSLHSKLKTSSSCGRSSPSS